MHWRDARPARSLPTATVHATSVQSTLRTRPVAPWRVLIAAGLLSLLIGAALARVLAGGPSAGSSAARAGTAPQSGLSSLPLAADDPVSSVLGAASPAYKVSSVGSGFQAANPAQRLQIHFDRSDVALSSGALNLGLGLRAVGYGESLRAVVPASPRMKANRVSYAHAGLSEWYVNGPLGLEQGFTLARAPSDLATGPLTLSLALSADAHAQLAPGGESLTFSQAGRSSLTYGGLLATDASGRALHSWLELRASRVLLRVDTRGARYPLRIDPLFHQGEQLAIAGEEGEGHFGFSVALSADGSTALVGAPRDHEKGAVWAFSRSGSTWTQQGPKLTISAEPGEGGEDQCVEEAGEEPEPGECAFGASVALSADGDTALIGDPSASARSGTAWVFARSGSTWTEGSMLAGASQSGEGRFGKSVALSADGNTALIGDPSAANGEGKAWAFARSGSTWTPGEEISDAEAAPFAHFGRSVALSADGNTALIGAPGNAGGVGAAWMFTRSGSIWTQPGERLTGGEESGEGRFGFSVALSADAATALIGGRHDGEGLGAAWVFALSGSTWNQQGPKLTATAENGAGAFGRSVALSADGNTALIGAPYENHYSGAVRVFTRSGATWTPQPEELASAGAAGSNYGYSVALSVDGRALVGGPRAGHNLGGAWTFMGGPGAPPPAITTVTPNEGPSAGGTLVTIEGSGFLTGATVEIGTAATSVNVVSETEITAQTAATPAGSDEVVVTDSAGSSTGGPSYTYLAPPQGGPNQVVTSPVTPSGGQASGNPSGSTGVLASQTIALPPPRLAVTGNLTPISGSVLVKLPGSSVFVALTTVRQVPFGTIIDAINGRVSVTTIGPHGGLQTVTFFDGEFKLTQGRNGIVAAALAGGDFSVCPTARERSHLARTSSKHASKKHVVRKLWAEGHGSYSTKGNYAAGAVLGTRWLTEDLCDGTLIHVATDRVAVTNLVNHRRVTVKAGHSYLAKAP